MDRLLIRYATGFKRVNSPDNETDLTLDSWSLEMGPIESYDLSSAHRFLVGWISVNLSGYGYLYPWTLTELRARAEALPEVEHVAELCRSMWPVPAESPGLRRKWGRRQMGELWPYPETNLPMDWYWGLHETG